MSAGPVEPSDRAAVAEVLASYADAIDRGDFDAVGALLAHATLTDADRRPIATGASEIAALYASTTRRHDDGTPRTAHLVTNLVVERGDSDDDLVARSRFLVLQATGRVPLQPIVVGRYVDRLARRDGRWVIVERAMVPEHWGDVSDHLGVDPSSVPDGRSRGDGHGPEAAAREAGPVPGSDEVAASDGIECISAVTLAVSDMGRAVAFYRDLGFEVRYGGADDEFTSLRAGPGYVNLQHDPAWRPAERVWGRIILWVDDVDAMHDRARTAGRASSTDPADAPWGERYFHISDPDGHELSFARPLDRPAARP